MNVILEEWFKYCNLILYIFYSYILLKYFKASTITKILSFKNEGLIIMYKDENNIDFSNN